MDRRPTSLASGLRGGSAIRAVGGTRRPSPVLPDRKSAQWWILRPATDGSAWALVPYLNENLTVTATFGDGNWDHHGRRRSPSRALLSRGHGDVVVGLQEGPRSCCAHSGGQPVGVRQRAQVKPVS